MVAVVRPLGPHHVPFRHGPRHMVLRNAAFEAGAHHPLGNHTFHLDHGPDYFAFFDRLGEVEYEMVLDGDRVVAVAARVLRTLGPGGQAQRCWYACDLKVHPEYRGRRLPLRMAAHAFLRAYRRCPRGHGISMNPGDGSENRVVRLLGRMRVLPVSLFVELVFFSLDAEQMARAVPIVEAHPGPAGDLSLRGVKVSGPAASPARVDKTTKACFSC